MSANVVVANIDESLSLPVPVLSAFNRTCRVIGGSTAFVDRVPYVADAIRDVVAWRWAGVISEEQEVALFGRLRAFLSGPSGDPGGILDSGTQAAVDLDDLDARHAQWDAEEAARKAGLM